MYAIRSYYDGPFSHSLEHILINVHHEELTSLLMHKLNAEFDGALNLALSIFEGTYKRNFFHRLVSSQLDMDRLDYLQRDCFFSGVVEGSVGADRIIRMLDVHNDEIVVLEKGRITSYNVCYTKLLRLNLDLVQTAFLT